MKNAKFVDIEAVKEHLKNSFDSYPQRYKQFKDFWNSDIQIVAQQAVETDAEIFFEVMENDMILKHGNFWEKLKIRIKNIYCKITNKKYRTSRLDWNAVYFIVDLIAKVQEDLKQGQRPGLKLMRLVEVFGNPEYYNQFPDPNCKEAMSYKLLAIKLVEGLKILNFTEN